MAANPSLTHDVFRKHFGLLQRSIISPVRLAGLLYADELIGKETRSRVTNTSAATIDKASWLLEAVQAILEVSSQPVHELKRLCDVLEEHDEPALRKIADRMRSSIDGQGPDLSPTTAINKAIMKNSADLQKAISDSQPRELISKLFGKHIIDYYDYEALENFSQDCSVKSKLAERIASTVEREIRNNPGKLTILTSPERWCGMLCGVALRIKHEYETHVPVNVQHPDTPSSTAVGLPLISKAEEEIPIPNGIPIPQEPVARKFARLRGEYSRTFLQIKAMVRRDVSLEKLKDQIEDQYSDLKGVIEYKQTTDEVMKLFQKKCNFPYFHELWSLVSSLHLEEAAEKIEKFVENRSALYEEIKAKDFITLALGEYERDNNVQVLFQENWAKDDTTLHDFEEFLREVFALLHKQINLKAVSKCLLIFICSTPFCVAGAIVRIVRESEQLLLKLGVVSITVGDNVEFKAHSSTVTQTDKTEVIYLDKNDEPLQENVYAVPPVASFESKIIYSPPVDFIMDNFNQLKDEDKRWTSPPFTTHPNGYQMCLQVTPNGFAEGRNSHLCVSARLMKGENDDHLPWPFRGTLTVQLVNHELNEQHVEHNIAFTDVDDEAIFGRVVNGEITHAGMIANVGCPVPKFIPLSQLRHKATGQIDDNLKFRIKQAVIYTPRVSFGVLQQPMPKSVTNFTMAGFQQYRKAGNDWHSDPFYTHPEGYMLCLAVSVNGQNKGKGSHVSVYVHMMAGPYDRQLTWPFERRVTVQLINWKVDENHVQRIIDIDRRDNASKRVRGFASLSGGTGWDQFVSHKYLLDTTAENVSYVEDDTIKFRIVDSYPLSI